MQLDQAHLETVLPKAGGRVLILKGSHTGEKAVLQSISEAKFQAEISLKSGDVKWMEYEDICKYSD